MTNINEGSVDNLVIGEIQNLIQRERRARDFQDWTEMAECYHSDAEVEISWFRGSAADFVAGSRKIAAAGTRSIHQMAPSVVTLRGNRALSDTGCEIHILTTVDGIDMIVSSQARLLSRVERRDGRWLLSSFRTLYVWDTLTPVRPSRSPELDEDELQRLRPSYRHLAYVMGRLGHPFPDTLPGVDDPATERALREKEDVWFEAGNGE
ncbi:nuclear transport factor 2 family protein [Sphingomonas sp. SRS2]|uniref:nuclear transport factor 2 family protein n=1 Tax=Sphingomonas sp. SRS2 TaxID=133190 RepID=UPI0006976019|nr:nuclear transport factor 2 family protein [Sphingomonas sp. SRS2]